LILDVWIGTAMSFLTDAANAAANPGTQPALPQGADLTALVAAKLCHDFISPSGAVTCWMIRQRRTCATMRWG